MDRFEKTTRDRGVLTNPDPLQLMTKLSAAAYLGMIRIG
jgi:hypothetical protein